MEDQNKSNQKKDKKNISRRDVLKSLATVPVVGAVAYGALKKKQYDHYLNSKIAEELGMSYSEPENKPAKMGGKRFASG